MPPRSRKTRAGVLHHVGRMELELHQVEKRYAGLRSETRGASERWSPRSPSRVSRHRWWWCAVRAIGTCWSTATLAKVDVLVIDEMGYLNLRPEQTNIFFKLMEERYRQRPTIITTNLDYAEWANFLGNKALVEALLSRLRHQCHTVKIDGPTLRDPAT
jgi:hypothetical protein